MIAAILCYLLAGAGAIGALWRPYIGLYVYVFFAVLRPKFMWGWAAGLNSLSDYVGWAMLIGWAIHGFGSWRLGRAAIPVAAFCMFFVWSALSAHFALYPEVSYPTIRELSKIFLPFLVGVSILDGQRARHLLWAMVLAQGYLSYEMNLSYLKDGYNRVAVEGYAMMDNNTFGIALVTTLGPAVALALATKNWIARAIAGVAALLILHTILLTFSRGAFVGLLAVGVIAFLIMPKRPLNIAVMVGIVLVTIRLIGPELGARYHSSFVDAEDRDVAATERTDLWERMFVASFDRPIFGLGPDNWPLVAHEYGFKAGKIGHSLWVQGLVELGFPGIGLLALLYGSTIIIVWRYSRRMRKVDWSTAVVAVGVVLSIVGYVVSAQFVTLPHLEVPYYTAMAGIVLLNGRRAMENVTQTETPAPIAAVPRTRIVAAPAAVATRATITSRLRPDPTRAAASRYTGP